MSETHQTAGKVLVIAGPTASGKKAAASVIAEKFDGEIVSADSRKVYRYIDIGTAKPPPEDRARIPHHLIDIVDPDEPFSAGDWAGRADTAVRDILCRGRLPVISGGTGFYIKAFREGLSGGISANEIVRKRLAKELEDTGSAALYRKLQAVDPDRASQLHENDTFRVLRALEVYETTGQPFSELRSSLTAPGHVYDYLAIGIIRDREELYRRINNRVDMMIEAGLVQEVRSVLGRGYARDSVALDTVGYKEWFPFFDDEMPFDACAEAVKRNTRRYAKRQLTWFRAVSDMEWFDPGDPAQAQALQKRVAEWLER